MMDISEEHTLVLKFDNDEMFCFKNIIMKLVQKPQSVGFLKRDFTDDENDLLVVIFGQLVTVEAENTE